MSAPERDVAIYMPAASRFYELGDGSAATAGGGAELQTYLLACALDGAGLRTAHVVWPLQGPAAPGGPDVVERGEYAGGRAGKVLEAIRIWRGLRRADAAVYVVRGGGPQLLIAAAFTALRRRRLVFAAAIDLDFDLDRPDRSRLHLALYRAALRRPDVVVVQTGQQLALAREALPAGTPIRLIPSFVEPAAPATGEPEAFVWIGRLVAYKRPIEVVRLAEALPASRFRMIFSEGTETPPGMVAELNAAGVALDNLELLGPRPRPEVLAEIERSIAVVSTSSSEGMPNVFLEAWARGIPVASLEYDPDGRIAERRIGIAAGGSRDRLAEELRELQDDRGLRTELGRNALGYIADVHDPAAVGGQWIEVLRDQVEGG